MIIRRLLAIARQRCVICAARRARFGEVVCARCEPLVEAAQIGSYPFTDGPLGGNPSATLTVRPGDVVPYAMYVRRGPGDHAVGMPTDERPEGIPRTEYGVYVLDLVHREYVWGGWCGPRPEWP